jgi:hypothetical protein
MKHTIARSQADFKLRQAELLRQRQKDVTEHFKLDLITKDEWALKMKSLELEMASQTYIRESSPEWLL